MTATFVDAEGSIFDSGADILVDPVNCVGVAGKGLALEFKKRWPRLDEFYRELALGGQIVPGVVYWWRFGVKEDPRIILFPTKDRWKNPSRLEWIEMGIYAVRHDILRDGLGASRWSIAFPALGCGLGGLDWKDVRPLIVEALRDIDGLTVYLYGPQEKVKPLEAKERALKGWP